MSFFWMSINTFTYLQYGELAGLVGAPLTVVHCNVRAFSCTPSSVVCPRSRYVGRGSLYPSLFYDQVQLPQRDRPHMHCFQCQLPISCQWLTPLAAARRAASLLAQAWHRFARGMLVVCWTRCAPHALIMMLRAPSCWCIVRRVPMLLDRFPVP